MNEFFIEYESYMGHNDSMTIRAYIESDARRIFIAQRALSEIIKISRFDI